MSNGVLIFAHNSRDVDYSLLSLISGSLAKKYLNVPVSLITDASTNQWIKDCVYHDRFLKTFEHIIEIDRPNIDNNRILYDGAVGKNIPFINSNRYLAYDLSPYDKTLLIDSDFLIFSDRLNHYWNIDSNFLIASQARDLFYKDRLGYNDKFISDVGISLSWATTVMFSKCEENKIFFDLIKSIKNNYRHYSDLFRFDPQQYRNDISFSIGNHITKGFISDEKYSLPDILTVVGKDILFQVKNDGKLIFLLSSGFNDEYILSSVNNLDIHIMNKQSIVRNAEQLLSLI